MVLKNERYELQKSIIDILNQNITEKMLNKQQDDKILGNNSTSIYYFIHGEWIYEVNVLNFEQKTFNIRRSNKVYDTFKKQLYSIGLKDDIPTTEEYYIIHYSNCNATLKKYVEPYNNFIAKRESIKHLKKQLIRVSDVRTLMSGLKPDNEPNTKSEYELFIKLFEKTEHQITDKSISEEQFIKLNTPVKIDGTQDKYYDNIFYFTQSQYGKEYFYAFVMGFNGDKNKFFLIRSTFYTDINDKVVYANGRQFQQLTDVFTYHNNQFFIKRHNREEYNNGFFNISYSSSYDVLTNNFNKTFEYRSITASQTHSDFYDITEKEILEIDSMIQEPKKS